MMNDVDRRHGPRRPRRRRAPRRRGSVYLLTISVSLLVTVIGITSLELQYTLSDTAVVERDIVRANLGARSALEIVLVFVEDDANWRDTYTHDTWTAPATYGDCEVRYKFMDDADGNLGDDDTEDVRIIAEAICGKARRVWSVELRPDSDTLELQIIRGSYGEVYNP